MNIEVVERSGRLIVETPYNVNWLDWCREHGGIWDAGSRCWTFAVERRDEVEAAIEEIFEESGE